MDQDAKVIAQLHGVQDELRRTKERIHSERSKVCEKRDRAIRERDEVYQVVNSLRADLGATVNQRLDVESISARLGTKLAKV